MTKNGDWLRSCAEILFLVLKQIEKKTFAKKKWVGRHVLLTGFKKNKRIGKDRLKSVYFLGWWYQKKKTLSWWDAKNFWNTFKNMTRLEFSKSDPKEVLEYHLDENFGNLTPRIIFKILLDVSFENLTPRMVLKIWPRSELWESEPYKNLKIWSGI